MNTATNINTIAITGANGFIGRYLVKALAEYNNISIRVLVRKSSGDNKQLPANVTEIQGDLARTETLREFLVPGCIVVNLAYSFSEKSEVNILLINNLISECKKKSIKRLIHCSTVAVYGRVNDNSVDELSQCNPKSDYGTTKLLIEKMFYAASQGDFEYINIRPTAVYGSEGQALMKLINNLVNGNVVVNYLRSCLFNTRSLNLVHVSNVVAAIIFLINTDKKVDGETYIISEDFEKNNNYSFVEKYLRKRLTKRKTLIPVLPLPLKILSLMLRMRKRESICPNMIYRTDKIRGIGFEYKISLEPGLDELIEWYQQNVNSLDSGDA